MRLVLCALLRLPDRAYLWLDRLHGRCLLVSLAIVLLLILLNLVEYVLSLVDSCSTDELILSRPVIQREDNIIWKSVWDKVFFKGIDFNNILLVYALLFLIESWLITAGIYDIFELTFCLICRASAISDIIA